MSLPSADDANISTSPQTFQNNGFLERSSPPSRSTSISSHGLFSKLTRNPRPGITLTPPPAHQPPKHRLIYPSRRCDLPRINRSVASASIEPSSTPLTLTLHATRRRNPAQLHSPNPLPGQVIPPSSPSFHVFGGEARVNALLAQIDNRGKSEAAIREIIRALTTGNKIRLPPTQVFLPFPARSYDPGIIRPAILFWSPYRR